MTEFAMNFDYPIFTATEPYDQMVFNGGMNVKQEPGLKTDSLESEPVLPPIVICPSEVEHINITLEKNQQCACKDCGKLFNSVWYLKQHAVKHSNDRPFKCKFCFKTYKFRSNLYQHKCPDRQKSGLTGRRARGGVNANAVQNGGPGTGTPAKKETSQMLKTKIEGHMNGTSTVAVTGGGATGGIVHPPQAPAINTMAGGNAHMMNTGYGEDADEAEISYGLCIRIEPASTMMPPPLPAAFHPPPPPLMPERPPDCIRLHPMPYDEVERYVAANKNKVHTCRKCSLHFPSESSLERHTAAHRHEDVTSFSCDSCPQKFDSKEDLDRHSSSHAAMGPWNCDGCSACFKSGVGLRRHLDACRSCRYRPFEEAMGLMESASAPIDPTSFLLSEHDAIPFDPERMEREKAESGIGSSPASSLLHTSPARSGTNALEDEFDENNVYGKGKKKSDDDDADSGFRSRVNSVTQSCSPGSSSAFSSDGGSPHRKNSHDGHHTNGGLGFSLSSFGSGTSYGQKLFLHEQSVGGNGFNSFTSLQSSSFSTRGPSSSLHSTGPTALALPLIHHPDIHVLSGKVDVLFDLDDVFSSSSIDVSLDSSSHGRFPSDLPSPDSPPLHSLLLFLLRSLIPYAALSSFALSRDVNTLVAGRVVDGGEGGGSLSDTTGAGAVEFDGEVDDDSGDGKEEK